MRIVASLFLLACAANPVAHGWQSIDQDAVEGGAAAQAAFAIDATLEGPAGTYFFVGDRYRRMSRDSGTFEDDGGSLPLFTFHLPFASVDAALAGEGAYADYAYFFKGDHYARYSWKSNRVDVQAPLAAWHLPYDAVDAAFSHGGKAFFFRGDRYARYDWASESLDFETSIADGWGLSGPVDAAIQRGDFSVFFRGDTYVRFDWRNATLTQHSARSEWPALLGLRDAPARRVVLYVTIDTYDHAGTHAHDANLGGLRASATAWRNGTYVDDFWAPQVSKAMLADPHVLALFGSGSFDEWAQYFPGTHPLFAHWAPLLRESDVPTFAVCGSHQFSALAFEGLQSVRHVGTTTTVETDGIARIPTPRPGEWGSYPVRFLNDDPLFAGIASPAYFSEYHHDEVIAEALHNFDLIGTRSDEAELLYGGASERHIPVTLEQRSRVQVMKHKTRLYYGTQFHPELDFNGNGRRLLANFFDLAALRQ